MLRETKSPTKHEYIRREQKEDADSSSGGACGRYVHSYLQREALEVYFFIRFGRCVRSVFAFVRFPLYDSNRIIVTLAAFAE